MDVFKSIVSKLSDSDRLCSLIFDEMAIKEYVSYSVKDDKVVGYEDFGSFQTKFIANHATVFMVHGIVSPWKQPIGFFFSSGPIDHRILSSLIREALSLLLDMKLDVKAVICDQGSNNRAALKGLGVSLEQPFISHQFEETFKKVYVIFDPPHLLKNTRNILKKHGFKKKDTQENILWKHINEFYKKDCLYEASDRKNCEDDVNHFLINLATMRKHTDTNSHDSRDDPNACEIISPTELPQDIGLQTENVLTYIGGFIVKKLKNKLCPDCVNALTGNIHTESPSHALLQSKQYSKYCTVRQIITHPYYNSTSVANDIALVVLAERLSFSASIKPICLPRQGQEVRVGEMCLLAGWGVTRGTSDANTLNQVKLPIISDLTCGLPDWYGASFSEPDTTFCAGYEQGIKDGCTLVLEYANSVLKSLKKLDGVQNIACDSSEEDYEALPKQS
ncbi:transposable element p transposase [Plakobranchus ocellatus]|uniref:Transposable element p transposase n=1 Tax=Plakobranchus ocellatus TaxID=259542 RepID=A0AAV4CLL1_9GAST|nr:transposable element p transposase [Plakobranchus ocellatus]